ncbi:MAG: hypothetical protein Sylvanvirus42_6, partial [Sylvanvirus sp.]
MSRRNIISLQNLNSRNKNFNPYCLLEGIT